MSYFLGLDWRISQSWQEIREREKTLKQLKRAIGEGAFGDFLGSSAELRTELAIRTDARDRFRSNVRDFRLHPEYRKLESDANQLTRKINELVDANTTDRRLVSRLEEAMRSEESPDLSFVERLYSEAAVELPTTTLRRYEEVVEFHNSIISNRKSYLEQELIEARERVSSRDNEKERLDRERQSILEIIRSHGAIDHLTQLQGQLGRLESDVSIAQERYNAARQLEGEKTELDIERRKLLQRSQRDLEERSDRVDHAIVEFEKLSLALYEEAGRLTVSPELNGLKFEILIQGASSKGITNMQTFCVDMMIMRLIKERNSHLSFLIHDSHLFDGVDERQIARALRIGHQYAESRGFQYIVTLNSDTVPHEKSESFDIDDHVLTTRLTDETEDGGLFGIRFG